ncbi:3-isopropylmalate dehydratase large subunit [Bradyrhizobium sp. U87765 SZCCT0131]|uniref:3-isopropylmalate dehydratase large subunit n=1 Tax=unclassified Bradyrhizobium TaxID=2631580 RepID=UPI001BAB60E0|nr:MULTISPECIES: 3-isopropylmalate dehydratase large subunit [unclassified Bradyrhizobium]MBR1221987.1 3-isopropylmalate dehydratase large subunit [Bradyrhizobium sp. U87765 SZCCT0131]MBR1263815.1 3-isopropylmalate dehydratase large subunit [Bradyrhizobium sp. U87765 SZCCT0134]MBR1302615.1 3-isopropylmalate dehydratase large subunit [Bradyrhizobium sp. U87765 SZCCT0110]MBR1320065.1 3-isopropylmalate dehydratase large subunit [Bradyrhizobium sp. U87765 SZCCT0109]MBR1348822.1 3-isopropylmalate d
MASPRTLYDKICDAHSVRRLDDAGRMLLYVDRTVLNEYTSPQAFTALREAGRKPWRPEAALAVVDHVNPTAARRTAAMADADAARQVDYLGRNCRDFGIELFDVLDPRQGIEHVVAPEQGFVLPGMVVAAGDSHTTTYGALGALGFGIGTSDIEHYLATQTLVYRRLKTMRITVDGDLPPGVVAKDIVMAVIRRIGADGATGFAVEFAGSTMGALGVEGRMTICNMIVEAGARGAVMAPDDAVFAYLKGRPRAPKGALWDVACASWRQLASDADAAFDREVTIAAEEIAPMVTWGTSPDQAVPIDGCVPDPGEAATHEQQRGLQRALDYMGLVPGTPMQTIRIDRAFIGSCTNARIDDLRQAATVVAGRRVADGVRAMVVPGSTAVRREAEAEGLDRIFIAAGFEWRQSGCSMCLAMNDDVLAPGERCASSTNRNFEGRQGAQGRTHLMSPAMVAAAAIRGHLADPRTFAGGQ